MFSLRYERLTFSSTCFYKIKLSIIITLPSSFLLCLALPQRRASIAWKLSSSSSSYAFSSAQKQSVIQFSLINFLFVSTFLLYFLNLSVPLPNLFIKKTSGHCLWTFISVNLCVAQYSLPTFSSVLFGFKGVKPGTTGPQWRMFRSSKECATRSLINV